jgi:raffinose/stachyose/melibiose transport system permease protein
VSGSGGTLARRAPVIVKYVVLTIVALVVVVLPIWLVVVNSWKTFGESQRLGFGLPETWALVENYRDVFRDARMERGFVNSIVVTGVSIVAMLLLGSGAAWVLARSRSRLDRVSYYVVVLAIIVPPSVVTTIALLKALGLYGGHPGLIAFYVGAFLPLTIFLIAGYIRTIPAELEDAARIDGCGHIGVFGRVIFPLLRPILATAGVLLLILVWNDFFWAFFILSGSDAYTLPLGLYYVSSEAVHQTRWDAVFTHVVLVSAPLLIVYVFAQRRIISGLTAGATHG